MNALGNLPSSGGRGRQAVLMKATVGPVVSDGIIVDCPPYVGRTRLGRDACALWREQARRGARPSVDPRPGWAAVA